MMATKGTTKAIDQHTASELARKRSGVDLGILERLLGFAVRRAQIPIYEDFFQTVENTGITPPLFAALVLIDTNPGIRQINLGRALGIAGSGVMSLVDRLERLGLAERQAVPGDRRANQLALTRQGRQTLDDLTRRIVEHDERISSKLTEDERNELFRLLAKL